MNIEVFKPGVNINLISIIFALLNLLLMVIVDKKEIRKSIEETIVQALLKFEVSTPSKKLVKLTDNFSKKFSDELKSVLKKKQAKLKQAKTPVKTQAKKAAKKKVKKVT